MADTNYGGTRDVNKEAFRGEALRFRMPDHLTTLWNGYRVGWTVRVASGKLPNGLTVNLASGGVGYEVNVSGTTNDPVGTYLSVVVATKLSGTGRGADPQPVTWRVALKLRDREAEAEEAATPDPLPDEPSTSPDVVASDVVVLSWEAAKDLCLAGKRIRMVSWADRWLEFSGVASWHLQPYSPITLATGQRRLLQTTDFPPDWFSGQWTTSGIPGQ